MTNQQLYLSIGIPTFTVLLALLISLWQNNRLSDKMDRLFEQHRTEFRDDLKQHRAEFRAEMNQFRSEVRGDLDQHRAEFKAEMNQFRSEVRGDLKEFRADMIAFRREIHGDMIPLHERVKAVEVRTDTQ